MILTKRELNEISDIINIKFEDIPYDYFELIETNTENGIGSILDLHIHKVSHNEILGTFVINITDESDW